MPRTGNFYQRENSSDACLHSLSEMRKEPVRSNLIHIQTRVTGIFQDTFCHPARGIRDICPRLRRSVSLAHFSICKFPVFIRSILLVIYARLPDWRSDKAIEEPLNITCQAGRRCMVRSSTSGNWRIVHRWVASRI